MECPQKTSQFQLSLSSTKWEEKKEKDKNSMKAEWAMHFLLEFRHTLIHGTTYLIKY